MLLPRSTSDLLEPGVGNDRAFDTRVLRDDGTVVLDGRAVCYTMPLRGRAT